MIGIPLGQTGQYQGEIYEAIQEKSHNSCEGCFWNNPEGCTAPLWAHLFDRCADNHVIYIKQS